VGELLSCGHKAKWQLEVVSGYTGFESSQWLNVNIIIYKLPTRKQILSMFVGDTVFSKLDAYHKGFGNFNAVMQQAIDKFVLRTSVTNKPKKPILMTGKVLGSVKKKHKLWRKWRQSNDQSAEAEYKNTQTKLVRW